MKSVRLGEILRLPLKVDKGVVSQRMDVHVESRKGKKLDFSLEPLGRNQPCKDVILAYSDLFQTSDLKNCKQIHMYCLVPKFLMIFFVFSSNKNAILFKSIYFKLLF